jgi:hypothetical protein
MIHIRPLGFPEAYYLGFPMVSPWGFPEISPSEEISRISIMLKYVQNKSGSKGINEEKICQ